METNMLLRTATLALTLTLTLTLTVRSVEGVAETRSTLYKRTKGIRVDQGQEFQLCGAGSNVCDAGKSRSCVLQCSTREGCAGVNYRTSDGSCMGVPGPLYSFGGGIASDTTWDNFSPDTGDVRDGKDWILVFRAQKDAFTGTEPPLPHTMLGAWNNDALASEDALPTMDRACYGSTWGACTDFYRSRLLTQWPSNNIHQVRLSLYTGGAKVVEVVFNGTGSTRDDWFQSSRLVSSPWTDLVPGAPNYISISGKLTQVRVFTLVTSSSEGCPETGWFLVLNSYSNRCPNEEEQVLTPSYDLVVPQFIYVPSNVRPSDIFAPGASQKAEVMAVFVKLFE